MLRALRPQMLGLVKLSKPCPRSSAGIIGDIPCEAVKGGTGTVEAKPARSRRSGRVAEWFKAAVLKTAVGVSPP